MKKIAWMGMMMVAGAAFAANVTDTDDTSWWSLADGVLTLDNSTADLSARTNTYTAVIGAGVTKIVKTGPGRVRLTGINTAFAGEIEVQAGILAGNVLDTADRANDTTYDNFGRPSAITIAQDAAFEITDPNKAGLDPPTGRTAFFTCPVRVQGAGPDGNGAIRRLYPRINGANGSSVHRVFNDVTLTGPTTFGCGGRWGISTKFDMGGYKLTIVKGDATAGQTIWEFGRATTFTISHPADVDVEGGEFLFERVTLKPDNVLAGMTFTMKGGLVRLYGTPTALPFPMAVPSGATSTIDGGRSSQDMTETNFSRLNKLSGSLALDGTLKLTAYSSNRLNALHLNGPINGTGTLLVGGTKNQGCYFLGGGASSQFGALVVTNGVLTIHDAAQVCVTNFFPHDQWGNPTSLPIHVGGAETGANVACLEVTNAVFKTPTTLASGRRPKLGIAFNSQTSGIMAIRPGAVVSNDLHIGNGGYGAVHQSGGKLFWRAGMSNDGFIGAGTYGYYGLTGGELETEGWINYGRTGRSIMLQRGGKMRVTKNQPLKLARSGWTSYAHYCILGGELESLGEIRFCDNGASAGDGADAVFTVKGAGAKAKVTDISQYAGVNSANRIMGVVSIADGGELTVDRIYKRESTTSGTTAAKWAEIKDICTNTIFYLTFDGGVLKTGKAGEFFYSDDGSRVPNRVLVYEKGATIDTDGKNVTWRAPFARPEGKGLDTITINNSTLTAANYAVGPGVVKIYNSGLFFNGGTAMVDFDDATRTQKAAVIVTCPGERYAEDNCLVRVENRDLGVVEIARTLRELGSGGLTKRGAGTLTLTSTNTYAGATRLEGGTLAFTHAQGYPGGDLEIAAAAVQGQTLAAPLLTANTLAFNAGKGVRVTEADTLDDSTFGTMKTVATFTNPISLPTLTLVDADGTAWANTRQWHLQLADGGRTLKFGSARGTQILFR